MSLKDLATELDAGTSVRLSQFRDRNGLWAKDPADCVDVFVVMEGGTEYVITYDEFKTLTKEQRLKLEHAPSSPAVP